MRTTTFGIIIILLIAFVLYPVLLRVHAQNYTPVQLVNSGTLTIGPVGIIGGGKLTYNIPAMGAAPNMKAEFSTQQDLTTIPGFKPNTNGNQISIYPLYIPSSGGMVVANIINNSSNTVTVGPLTLKWSVYTQ